MSSNVKRANETSYSAPVTQVEQLKQNVFTRVVYYFQMV